jgi:IS5 family transposase
MEIYADKAYVGKPVEKSLRACKAKNRIQKKTAPGGELSNYAKRKNKAYSKVRARVEHVFGSIEKSLGGLRLRCIGLARAYVAIGLKNIAYNMKRYEYLTRCG